MGRFTQEDPIGLAGGLNLYGFAGGDPVNFSDPFGLCPEDRRDEAGLCPGGLSVEQWDVVKNAALDYVNDMTVAAELLRRLDGGSISPAGPGDPAFSWDGEASTALTIHGDGGMYLFTMTASGLNMFENHPSDVAFALSHEYGHVRQLNFLGPYTTPWDRMRVIRQMRSDRTVFERGANDFACSVTTGPRPRYTGRCR